MSDIPTQLTAPDAYEAGRRLGRDARASRAQPALVEDIQRYVTAPYGHYAFFDFIHMGFVDGYQAAAKMQ